MIVKNKKKFVRAILIIITLTVGLVLIMTSRSESHQEIIYKTVAVSSGETLWDIAEKEQKNNKYYKNNDIRDIILDIKDVNNLNNSNLKVNQTLEIPTYG